MYGKIKSIQRQGSPITDWKINFYKRQDLGMSDEEEEEGKNKLIRPLEAHGQKTEIGKSNHRWENKIHL